MCRIRFTKEKNVSRFNIFNFLTFLTYKECSIGCGLGEDMGLGKLGDDVGLGRMWASGECGLREDVSLRMMWAWVGCGLQEHAGLGRMAWV
jgi:hypothetical protein